MLISIQRMLATAFLIGALSGCGSNNESKPNVKSYPQDGYMGITSVNPNNPLHPTYHHYRDDTALMKAVLAQIPGIESSRITLKGPKANVRIRLQNGLTNEQADEIRSTAQMALATNMPRYTILVTYDR
jgi:hypothetical protein